MKKILFVFNHPAPYKVRLFNELSKHFDLTVIFERDSANNRTIEFYSETKYDFKTVSIKGVKLGDENILSNAIKNHLKTNKYDLVVMNGYSTFAEMEAIKYLKKNNIKYCLYINGGIKKEKESKIRRNIKTKYISGANFYISPDQRSNTYLKHYGAYTDKIYNYTYSTIYKDEILLKRLSQDEIDNLKNKYNINSNEIYVSCGQLIPRKNFVELVQSWPEDEQKMLLIIGEGPQHKKLENLIQKRSVKNIKLMGYLNRKQQFEIYRFSKAFIFPSNEDIYGHVVNEAMSQGLPVISTKNVNSSLKLINDENNGFLINEVSKASINNALKKIDQCTFEACISTAKENTIEKMVLDHLDILNN